MKACFHGVWRFFVTNGHTYEGRIIKEVDVVVDSVFMMAVRNAARCGQRQNKSLFSYWHRYSAKWAYSEWDWRTLQLAASNAEIYETSNNCPVIASDKCKPRTCRKCSDQSENTTNPFKKPCSILFRNAFTEFRIANSYGQLVMF